MNRTFKKCLVAGASLVMLASAGAGINNVTVNARHVRTHRTYRRHGKRALRRYRHVRNVHRYNVYRLHHRRSLYSLEEQLGSLRADQANHYLRTNFYPYLRKETKKDPEDYGHDAGTFFKGAMGDVDNGGLDRSDASEAANGRYFNRTKFVKNYIKGLTNYLRFPFYYNDSEDPTSNGAENCGAYDANYYASRLVTERYARQHHMSKRWLRSNLNHPIYGYQCNPAGTGMNNFMSGAQFTEWGNNKYYRTNLKQERENDASRQYLTGLQYSHAMKPRYYSLRKPSYQELTYLKNCNYVRNSKDYTNLAISGN